MGKYRPDTRYPWYWNKLRFKIFYRDDFICQLCGRQTIPHSKDDLESNCHHIEPISVRNDNSVNNLTTLCRRCHSFVHGDYIKRKKYGKLL